MMMDADVTDGRGKANSITLLRHTSENDQSNRGPQVDIVYRLVRRVCYVRLSRDCLYTVPHHLHTAQCHAKLALAEM